MSLFLFLTSHMAGALSYIKLKASGLLPPGFISQVFLPSSQQKDYAPEEALPPTPSCCIIPSKSSLLKLSTI